MSTKSGRSTRHIEVALPKGVTYRPGDHLCVVPRNSLDAGRARREAVRLRARTRSIRLKTTGGRHAPFPIDGPVQRAPHPDRLCRAAGGRDAQAGAGDGRAHALPDDQAKAGSAGRARRRTASTPTRPRFSPSADRCSTCWRSIPACELTFAALSRNAAADGPALLFDLVVAQRDARRMCRSPSASSRARRVPGRASSRASARPIWPTRREGERRPCLDQGDQGRLPAAGRSGESRSIMIGPGTGSGAVPRLLPGARLAEAAGQDARAGDAVLRLPPPRPGFLYRKELEAMAEEGHRRTACRLLAPRRQEDLCAGSAAASSAAAVWQLIQAGAHIYVCGDGSRMEPDVKRALTRIYAEEKDVDAGAADAWMER